MRMQQYIRTAMAMVGAPRPFILYHQPTARCDCRCKFCNGWLNQPEEEDALPSVKVLDLLDRARAAGYTMYTVWGSPVLGAT